MSEPRKTLEIRTSPHILSGYSVDTIMFNVVLALLPAVAFAVYAFGLAALATLSTALVSCLLTERLACRWSGEGSTLSDWSVTITGLLYGLTLLNPALVGRAFLQAAFPVAMTTWTPGFSAGRFAALPTSTLTWPFSQPIYDGLTTATPLALWKFDRQLTDAGDLALGFASGSLGETSSLLILLGGGYLIARNMMNWRIPVAILASVFALSGALWLLDPESYASPWFMLASGGLMLGALFMATDMVGSPMTGLGCVLYGVLIGLLVVAIRTWGGMPEGVMYAILLGNAVSPHIDNWIQPKVYGSTAREAPR
jgi:electron transport complex protein RnfD